MTHFVAGVGTGGTITGTGRGLTDLSDGAVEIVGFEPDEQLHAIDGLKYLKSGDHYHPDTYDESALDRTEYVTTSDAYDRARALRERYLNREIEIADPGQHDEATIREHLRVDDQFVVGTSAGGGAAAVAGLDEAGALADDDVVVFMLCDRGDKYADIPLWRSTYKRRNLVAAELLLPAAGRRDDSDLRVVGHFRIEAVDGRSLDVHVDELLDLAVFDHAVSEF